MNWTLFSGLLLREWQIASRRPQQILNPMLFFVVVLLLFPLGMSPDSEVLKELAPGLIWVAALLAGLLASDHLFQHELECGSLEQLLLSPHPIPAILLVKIMAHWSQGVGPLLIITPLLALMLHLNFHALITLECALLLGTPTLCLLSAVGSALTLNQGAQGMLVALLVLPLAVPVLIFGAGAVRLASTNMSPEPLLLLLFALLLFSVCLLPFAIAGALRLSFT